MKRLGSARLWSNLQFGAANWRTIEDAVARCSGASNTVKELTSVLHKSPSQYCVVYRASPIRAVDAHVSTFPAGPRMGIAAACHSIQCKAKLQCTALPSKIGPLFNAEIQIVANTVMALIRILERDLEKILGT